MDGCVGFKLQEPQVLGYVLLMLVSFFALPLLVVFEAAGAVYEYRRFQAWEGA